MFEKRIAESLRACASDACECYKCVYGLSSDFSGSCRNKLMKNAARKLEERLESGVEE